VRVRSESVGPAILDGPRRCPNRMITATGRKRLIVICVVVGVLSIVCLGLLVAQLVSRAWTALWLSRPSQKPRPGAGKKNATHRYGLQLTGVTQRAFIPPPSPALAG